MAEYASEVGAECVQIFAKSPRMWRSTPYNEKKLSEIATIHDQNLIGPIFTHASYLLNLTTDKEELYEKSVHALADELTKATQLGARGVCVHMGTIPQGNVDLALKRGSSAIERAFEIAGGTEVITARCLIENTAGAGTLFGGDVSQVTRLVNETQVPRDRIGFVIDTCHAWAYGYDVSKEEGWDEIASQIEPAGLDRLLMIHANDCKYGRGERRDAHEWAGHGMIGEHCFYDVLHRKDFDHVCMVEEMPGTPPEKDIVNIEVLKKLREEKGYKPVVVTP